MLFSGYFCSAGLPIPKPPSEVSEPPTISQPVPTTVPSKTKKGKLLEASSTLTTALYVQTLTRSDWTRILSRNLFIIDYLTEHPEDQVTVTEFREIYKNVDPTIIKVCINSFVTCTSHIFWSTAIQRTQQGEESRRNKNGPSHGA